MNTETIKALPKIDLHCHLDGSLTPLCVGELLHKEVNAVEMQVSNDCQNLAEYLEKFELPIAGIQTAEGLHAAGLDFIREAAKENVRYIEARFAPLLSVHEGLDVAAVMQAVLTGMEEGRKEYEVDYQVIACVMRHHALSDSRQMIKELVPFQGKGLCALDLAGNEAAFPMKNFVELFEEAEKLGFVYTLHAGECGSVDNIVDSVNCGAKRIGHGIAMMGYKEVQALCKEKQIGIEMCPISNLQTKAVENPKKYPLQEFLDAGLLVTLNTDNRTVSNTSISKEIAFVQENYGISDEEIMCMMENAIEVSFAPAQVKEKLRKEWRNYRGEI